MSLSLSDLSSAGVDMTLSDLDVPTKLQVYPPPCSSRFTLLAQRAEQDISTEADESYVDEGQNDRDAQSINARPDRDTSIYEEHANDPPEDEVVEGATPRLVNKSVEPASQSIPQSLVDPLNHVSEEDRLRQQLIDMQRLNEAFSSYHIAVQAVGEKQKVLLL
jgi:hypothetical protein